MVCVSPGDIEREMDPFFPFEEAVDVWARTFAALGIQYKGATMRLDLCDRPGKYSNGFCHWPQPAWRKVAPTSHCDHVTSCLAVCAFAACHAPACLVAHPRLQMLLQHGSPTVSLVLVTANMSSSFMTGTCTALVSS